MKVCKIHKDLIEDRERSYRVLVGRSGRFPVVDIIYLPKSVVSARISKDIVTLTVPKWILEKNLEPGMDIIQR